MDYLELLKRYDHSTHWESPPGFNYKAATAKFEIFTKELSEALDSSLKSETGRLIQDASFHSQIFVPLADGGQTVIRYSNFGNMVTFTEDEVIPESMVELFKNLFKKHEYIYVPEDILIQKYTGQNTGVTGISTWWIRYFDWV